jgi:hypothetical protein
MHQIHFDYYSLFRDAHAEIVGNLQQIVKTAGEKIKQSVLKMSQIRRRIDLYMEIIHRLERNI